MAYAVCRYACDAWFAGRCTCVQKSGRSRHPGRALCHDNINGLAVGDVTGDGSPDAVVATTVPASASSASDGVTSGTAQLWVRSTSPNDFGSGMTQTYTPTVTFARDVVPSSVTTSTVRILNGRNGSAVPATVTYDAVEAHRNGQADVAALRQRPLPAHGLRREGHVGNDDDDGILLDVPHGRRGTKGRRGVQGGGRAAARRR